MISYSEAIDLLALLIGVCTFVTGTILGLVSLIISGRKDNKK